MTKVQALQCFFHDERLACRFSERYERRTSESRLSPHPVGNAASRGKRGPHPRPSSPRPSSPDPLHLLTGRRGRTASRDSKDEGGQQDRPSWVPLSRGGGWGGRERGRGEGLGRGRSEAELAPLGVCGHAGLFGDARDLWRLGLEWLAPGRLLKPEGVAAALAGGGPFALGWWRRTLRGSAGPALSPTAFGHTGFAGNCFWIDPEGRRIFVMLAARCDPAANMNHWRRRFNSAAARAYSK